MKNIIAIFAVLAFSATFAFAQTTPSAQKADEKKVEGPVMQLKEVTIDYGTIEQNADPYRVFAFTNTGTEPLIISNAKGSCGCTVPTYPKEPIMPGQSAEIKVRYDTNRIGAFTKTVTLTTNEANPTRTLTIKGVVEKKAEDKEGVPASAPSIFNNSGR